MKHKTWFRLVLKAIGVVVFAFAIGSLIDAVDWLVWSFDLSQPSFTLRMVFGLIGPLVQLALGLYLFFGGEWIVNMAIPSNRPYCPDCGYDLSNAVSKNCPECGTPLPEQSHEDAR